MFGIVQYQCTFVGAAVQKMLKDMGRKFSQQQAKKRKKPPPSLPAPAVPAARKPDRPCMSCGSTEHSLLGYPISPVRMTSQEEAALQRAKKFGNKDLAEHIMERIHRRQEAPNPQ